MKKSSLLLVPLLSLLILSTVAGTVFAASVPSPNVVNIPALLPMTIFGPPAPTPTVVDIPCPLPQNLCTVPGLIGTFSIILIPLVGLALLAMIIYGGVTKLTAAGDAEKEKKAMQIIQSAVIGAVIIVLAGLVVTTIGALLGVKFFT